MPKRKHLMAFNRAVKARRADTDPVLAAFVELGRDLARSLDAADGKPTSSLVTMYRQVLKELARMPASVPSAPVQGAHDVSPKLTSLDEFRESHGFSK